MSSSLIRVPVSFAWWNRGSDPEAPDGTLSVLHPKMKAAHRSMGPWGRQRVAAAPPEWMWVTATAMASAASPGGALASRKSLTTM